MRVTQDTTNPHPLLRPIQEARVEVDMKRPLGMKLSKSCAVHTVVPGGQFHALGIGVKDQVPFPFPLLT